MDSLSNTLFVGKVLHRLKSVDSTNNFARTLLSKTNPPEGTAIIARNQTRGRGQIGTTWESQAEQNLLLSLILYPRFLHLSQQYELNKAIALAVYETVTHFCGKDATIKWPNDIFWKDKKLAGMLIENSIATSKIELSIVGIGLNVNQEKFPPGLKNATSMSLAASTQFELEEVFENLCANIEKRYLQLRSFKLEEINDDYLFYLYRLGKVTLFQVGKERFYGKINGVDNAGRLLVERDGVQQSFGLKEIVFL